MRNIIKYSINFYRDTPESYRFYFLDSGNPFLEESITPIKGGLEIFMLIIVSYICIKYLWVKYIKSMRTESILILLTYLSLVLFLVVIILLSQGIIKYYPVSVECNNTYFNTTVDNKEKWNYSMELQVVVGLSLIFLLILV